MAKRRKIVFFNNGFFLNKTRESFFDGGASSRGFNMFTAIVAVILLMIGVVLTNTLISAEEKTSRQIYNMLNSYQKEDVAAIARADALQTFNYNFRERIEDYLSFDQSELGEVGDNFQIGYGIFNISNDSDFSFEEMKESFREQILLASDRGDFEKVLKFVSDRMIDQFRSFSYGKYSVYLSDSKSSGKTATFLGLKKAMTTSDENLLEIVDCGDDSCENGSFYFNIPLNKLDDETYEAMPRIVVKDLVTQEQIQVGILPRTNLKIYVPIRFFKAIYEARKSALLIKNAYSELSEYKLGFCDAGICSPRKDPKVVATERWENECPRSDSTVGSEVELANNEVKNMTKVVNYFSGGGSPGLRGLKAHGVYWLCKVALNPYSNPFQTNDDTFKLKDEALTRAATGPGEAIEADIPGCNFHKLSFALAVEDTFEVTNRGLESKLRCSRIRGVIVELAFIETNPLYIVRGTYEKGKSNVYKIRITDERYEGAQRRPLGNCESRTAPKECVFVQ